MSEPASAAIEFRVLGPVEAVRDGILVPLGGPRQQTMLALLLLQPGRSVADDRLVEEIWHGAPPAGAATSLRVYVSRLRNVLGDASIRRRAGGYALDVPAERVDAQRFERLLAEGEEALARGAARRAATRIEAALELWRGRPFGALADEGALTLEATRLEELYTRAREARIEAALALGDDAELVEELEALVAEHPYRERLWRQLMLALYRSGRQADALGAYRRARKLLDEELGVEPSEELRALEQAILRQEVPPAQPPEERHNLPAALSSFVGREAELTELARLRDDTRLLTLTGIGGVGKTRLALETARRALPEFADGVYFVDFSALTDPGLVPTHVGSILGVRESADRGIDELLLDRLRSAELLLVLDNCEHVRDACAELARDLLSVAPRLRILATSREVLGGPGEVDYSVPPLAPPEAVELFLARVHAARPQLAFDDRAVATAGRICSELEDLPLALELAAARARALSLEEIASKLSDRFRFLVSWRRLASARHRTLREAIDWSHELLSADERRLLRGLSVFKGGFTLHAAGQVCLGGDEERALDLVQRLVEASLVIPDEAGGESRYRLLETVRQYAAERLAEESEEAELRAAHARYFLELAEERGPRSSASLHLGVQGIAPEDANLDAALRWGSETDAAEHQLRLVSAMWRYWWARGELTRGRAWLEDALRHEDADETLRSFALEGAAGLAWAAGDFDQAEKLGEEAWALVRDTEDAFRSGAPTLLGHLALERSELDRAASLYEESLRGAEQFDRERGVHASRALGHLNLAGVRLTAGDLDRAAAGYAAAIDLYSSDDDRYGVALAMLYLGYVELERGRLDDAARNLGLALDVFAEMDFPQYASQCLDGIAELVSALGRAHEAVVLLAAATALRERLASRGSIFLREVIDRVAAAARAELGADAFEAAWSEGLGLPKATAFDRARAALATASPLRL